MLESATEFSVRIRTFGHYRRDITLPGRRNPIARMRRVKHDEYGKKIKTNLRSLNAGSEFQYTIGFVDRDTAVDGAREHLGSVSKIRSGDKGTVTGEFDQYGLGILVRVEEPDTRLVHYYSDDSAGFTVSKPWGSSRCDFTVHDERVNRVLLMTAYLREERLSPVETVTLGLLAGVLRVLSHAYP